MAGPFPTPRVIAIRNNPGTAIKTTIEKIGTVAQWLVKDMGYVYGNQDEPDRNALGLVPFKLPWAKSVRINPRHIIATVDFQFVMWRVHVRMPKNQSRVGQPDTPSWAERITYVVTPEWAALDLGGPHDPPAADLPGAYGEIVIAHDIWRELPVEANG